MERRIGVGNAALPCTAELARAIASVAHSDGDHPTLLPALSLHRRQRPTDPLHCIYSLGLGVVAQGCKQVLLGGEVIHYGPGQSLLTTLDLPVISQVTRASIREPFLGLMLLLDTRQIMRIAAAMPRPPSLKPTCYRSITIETLDEFLLRDLVRLIELLDEPELLPLLAPLIQEEILVRLLSGPHGPQLQHLAARGSPSHQIANCVAWLKLNFMRTLKVDALAARAHMSPSTFRQHFRALTGTSPLQYQKQLRLQQARQLMLSQNLDAGVAGIRVGYESASQFSREYRRLFGAPPQQDIRRISAAQKF